jgi:hypothetical protein
MIKYINKLKNIGKFYDFDGADIEIGTNMKLLLYFLAILTMFSCSHPVCFYQLYDTTSENVKYENDEYYFENNELKINYDLWENQGQALFKIFNKTNNFIYINLVESNFIRNGQAFDYFLNREIGESDIKALSVSKDNYGLNYLLYGPVIANTISQTNTYSQQSLNSIKIKEKEIVTIPPKSFKIFFEYFISKERYRSCELLLYPEDNDFKVLKFSRNDSPLIFSNIISYSIKPDLSEIKRIENVFWVTEITNLSDKLFVYKNNLKPCFDEEFDINTDIKESFSFKSTKRFYIKYDYDPFIRKKH